MPSVVTKSLRLETENDTVLARAVVEEEDGTSTRLGSEFEPSLDGEIAVLESDGRVRIRNHDAHAAGGEIQAAVGRTTGR